MLYCVPPAAHGIAERQSGRVMQVSCVIKHERDSLHGTLPRALNLKEKWRRSCKNCRLFSVRGDDKIVPQICRSANLCCGMITLSCSWRSTITKFDLTDCKVQVEVIGFFSLNKVWACWLPLISMPYSKQEVKKSCKTKNVLFKLKSYSQYILKYDVHTSFYILEFDIPHIRTSFYVLKFDIRTLLNVLRLMYSNSPSTYIKFEYVKQSM
jgi:hypothetical protein